MPGLKKIMIRVFLLLMLIGTIHLTAEGNAVAADAVVEKNNLAETVASLIANEDPIPLIISKCQQQGFADDEIVSELIKSDLSLEEIALSVFQNHVSYDHILSAFKENGYDEIDILQLLASAGVDKDIFFRAGSYYNIPEETLVAIYYDAKEVPAESGSAAVIQSVTPQPALITVGISDITAGDAFLNQPETAISTCRWVCEWVCE